MIRLGESSYDRLGKLLQRDNSFTYFENIDDDTYIRVFNEAERFKKELPSLIKRRCSCYLNPKDLELNAVLQYLLSPRVHLTFKSYDEKILFFILVLDQDLNVFKTYIESNYPKKPLNIPIVGKDKDDILEEKRDYSKKMDLIRDNLVTTIRSNYGACDSRILKYEKAYFDMFEGPFGLVEKSGLDFSEMLTLYFSRPVGFKKINHKRYEEINLIAQDYISQYGNSDYKTCLYHLFKQKNFLGLKDRDEQIMFFILVLDPNLRILTSFNQNCNWKNIYKEMYEDFGFFSNMAYISEENFRKKFTPEVKISEFYEPKK